MKFNLRYWICQILGWGGWTMINVFFVYLFASDMYLKPPGKKEVLFGDLFIVFIWAILSTHILRFVLKKIQWMRLPSKKVVMLFIAGVTLTGLTVYYGSKYTALLTNTSMVEFEKKEGLQKAVAKERDLNLTNIDYYSGSRNKTGQWQYQEQHLGRFWWDIIFTFILVALWLLIYMVWHYVEKDRNDQVDKLNLEKNVKELELKTIKSHINPHFIFNSL